MRLIDSQLDTIRQACRAVLAATHRAHARHIELDELVNETWIGLAGCEDRYQPHRGSLRAWVYKTAKKVAERRVTDAIRDRSKRDGIDADRLSYAKVRGVPPGTRYSQAFRERTKLMPIAAAA